MLRATKATPGRKERVGAKALAEVRAWALAATGHTAVEPENVVGNSYATKATTVADPAAGTGVAEASASAESAIAAQFAHEGAAAANNGASLRHEKCCQRSWQGRIFQSRQQRAPLGDLSTCYVTADGRSNCLAADGHS